MRYIVGTDAVGMNNVVMRSPELAQLPAQTVHPDVTGNAVLRRKSVQRQDV